MTPRDWLEQLRQAQGDGAVQWAQRLAATGDPDVIAAVLDAVERPENRDVQGPLLQALMALDCGAHLVRLAALMGGEGYEVKFMTVNVMESIAAPVAADQQRQAAEMLHRLREDGGALPQEEWNMIDYALQLVERLPVRGT
ncbi:MAG: hypothetical protein Kow0059_06270 [Candidatus Sumerlaeia bacterium]